MEREGLIYIPICTLLIYLLRKSLYKYPGVGELSLEVALLHNERSKEGGILFLRSLENENLDIYYFYYIYIK